MILEKTPLPAAAGGRALAALERTRERYGSGILRTTYLAGRQSTYADGKTGKNERYHFSAYYFF